ncbi:hypothetical protein C6W10_25985 [Plantactinospora sp. BB1]|nr:hypothetical protein C6W10_25985 [Plantactinospora sp. BB1]
MAQQGSDAILAARLLCDMARVNADLGNPMQSIELLTLGLHISQSKAPAAVSAKLHSMEAKTFAILGQVKQCELAIGRAERKFSVDDGVDTPSWIGYFDRAQFSGVLGSCYRDLAPKGKQFAAQAEKSIKEAMTSRNKKQIHNRALDHLNLATVWLSQRELNGMAEQAGEALELAAHLKSHRVHRSLHRLSRAALSVDAKERSVQALHQQVSELPTLNA